MVAAAQRKRRLVPVTQTLAQTRHQRGVSTGLGGCPCAGRGWDRPVGVRSPRGSGRPGPSGAACRRGGEGPGLPRAGQAASSGPRGVLGPCAALQSAQSCDARALTATVQTVKPNPPGVGWGLRSQISAVTTLRSRPTWPDPRRAPAPDQHLSGTAGLTGTCGGGSEAPSGGDASGGLARLAWSSAWGFLPARDHCMRVAGALITVYCPAFCADIIL